MHLLEQAYPEARITVRGAALKITGTASAFLEIKSIVQELVSIGSRHGTVHESDVQTILAIRRGERNAPAGDVSHTELSDVILYAHGGATVRAKTPGQRRLVDISKQNDIVFAIGPAGTGKTYTAVALAVRALKERQVKKIVLVRPAVEAGENLKFGFFS